MRGYFFLELQKTNQVCQRFYTKQYNKLDFVVVEKIPAFKMMSDYKEFYLLQQSKAFLDKVADKNKTGNKKKYIIAISSLVGEQSCHRDVDSFTTVDFPNISPDLIAGNMSNNTTKRVVENNAIFTEMDHGYINPISDQYEKAIAATPELRVA
ncbi:MAG: hypothetical protein INR73_15335 [Williamsia sp.]|nr:hypothetical protein [Williamsia sp.]